jgi:predicted transglutaminase-like cysteine proteinase
MGPLRVLVLLPLLGLLHACTSLDAVSESAAKPLPLHVPFAKAPPGFVAFCERTPDQCSATGRSVLLPLDARTWETLEGVNTATNLAIAPKADFTHYGVEEYWTIPTDGYGDCDDYVLAKRNALIVRGIPESALRIAIVFTPRFVRHTVLTVATDKGTFVLDNLRDDIVSWDKAEYGWIKREDPASSSGWVYF